MSEWFEVGMKVVCVDDRYMHDFEFPEWVKRGRVYTVRWVGHEFGRAALRLEGIYLSHFAWEVGSHDDMSIAAYRFRPLRKRKTDISVFQRLLKTEKVEVKA